MGGSLTRTFLIALTLLAVAVPFTAHADHAISTCPQYDTSAGTPAVGFAAEGEPTDWRPHARNPAFFAGAGAAYVVGDEMWGTFLFSFWIYEESNGVEGLQRHDGYCSTPGYASDELADTLLF